MSFTPLESSAALLGGWWLFPFQSTRGLMPRVSFPVRKLKTF